MKILEFIFIAGCTCAADSIIVFITRALLSHSVKGYKRILFTLSVILIAESIALTVNILCHTAVRYDTLISFLPFTIIFSLTIASSIALLKTIVNRKSL